jgi:hypothetical protein
MSLRTRVFVLCGLGFAAVSTVLGLPPDLRLVPDGAPLSPGDTAQVEIRLRHTDAGLPTVSGAGLTLSFDTRWLRFVGLTPSPLFGTDTLLLVRVADDAQSVSFASTQRAGDGIRGDHVLFTARFVGTDIGSIEVAEMRLDETLILLSDGQLLQPDSEEGALDVAPEVVWPGDANQDGQVDETDLLAIAMHFGRTGPPRPDTSMTFTPHASHRWGSSDAPHADVNGDGVVDMRDALSVPSLHPAYPPDQPTLTRISLPFAQPGDRILLELAVDGELLGVAARFRIPSTLRMTATPDISPWSDSHMLLTHLRHEPETGLMGVVVTRTRLGVPLVDGASRLRLTFDVPDGLNIPSDIELVSVSALSSSLALLTPTARLDVNRLTDLPDAPAADRPMRLELHPNHPNPFNPTTLLRYDVAEDGWVRLSVFDLAGREIMVLADGHHAVGAHVLRFDASELASGVYVCRLQSESETRIRKITLIQ